MFVIIMFSFVVLFVSICGELMLVSFFWSVCVCRFRLCCCEESFVSVNEFCVMVSDRVICVVLMVSVLLSVIRV